MGYGTLIDEIYATPKYGRASACKFRQLSQERVVALREERYPTEKRMEAERAEAIQAARELYYGEAVIEKLKAATTLRQLDRILMEARAAM